MGLPSSFIEHGWLEHSGTEWRFLARKITYFNAPFSSKPCLITRGYTWFRTQWVDPSLDTSTERLYEGRCIRLISGTWLEIELYFDVKFMRSDSQWFKMQSHMIWSFGGLTRLTNDKSLQIGQVWSSYHLNPPVKVIPNTRNPRVQVYQCHCKPSHRY